MRILIISLLLILSLGCQLPSANYFRDEIVPRDTVTKVALSPLLLPAYAVLCVGDIVIINPIRGAQNVPKVSSDIWDWQSSEPWLGYGALLPVKLVGIPAAAIGTTIFSEQFTAGREE